MANLLHITSRGQQDKIFVTSLLVQLNNRGKGRNTSRCLAVIRRLKGWMYSKKRTCQELRDSFPFGMSLKTSSHYSYNYCLLITY